MCWLQTSPLVTCWVLFHWCDLLLFSHINWWVPSQNVTCVFALFRFSISLSFNTCGTHLLVFWIFPIFRSRLETVCWLTSNCSASCFCVCESSSSNSTCNSTSSNCLTAFHVPCLQSGITTFWNFSHLRKEQCSLVQLKNIQLSQSSKTKYLDFHKDSKVTWNRHTIKKRKQINLEIKDMCWLIGKKYRLSLGNKLQFYKSRYIRYITE